MKIMKKLFAPKEVKVALGILDEAAYTFIADSSVMFAPEAFQIVRNNVEKIILKQKADFVKTVRDGKSPRHIVFSLILTVTGDLLKSGQYHIYRGVLNTLGPGVALHQLFKRAVDELAKIDSISTEKAREIKLVISEEIKAAG